MVHECSCIVLCCTATEQTGAKFCAQTGSICTHTSQCTQVAAELQYIQKQTQQMHNQGCCCCFLFCFFHQQKTKCRENANTKSDKKKIHCLAKNRNVTGMQRTSASAHFRHFCSFLELLASMLAMGRATATKPAAQPCPTSPCSLSMLTT